MPLSNIVSTRATLDRRMVAHDLWPRRLLDRRAQISPELPAEVFWPESATQVADIVKYAIAHQFSVIPFGAGSGVCDGISPSSTTLIIDLKRLTGNVKIDSENKTVSVNAGMNGERFERHLNALGYSCGHFPSSIYCSTVGGWVAARGAGQLSSRYGKIEDMLLAFTAVDGLGRIFKVSLNDKNGPALLRLFIGNEGSLCIFTSLTFRVHALSSHRWMRGFSFPDLDTGLAALQKIMSAGESPSVMRLYDPLDTVIAGGVPAKADANEKNTVISGPISCAGIEDSGPHHEVNDAFFEGLFEQAEEYFVFRRPKTTRRWVGRMLKNPSWANRILEQFAKGSKFIIGLEGDEATLKKRGTELRKLLISAGGTDTGTAPGEKWLKHRHRVSYKMARTYAVGGWVDTMEVAVRWENVALLYHEVRKALRDVAVVMCHFSHAYLDGCSLYFTFAGGGGISGKNSAHTRYDLAWHRAMEACQRRGANISHHHGIGRSKAQMLKWNSGTQAAFQAFKDQLDPHRVLNPGVFGAAFTNSTANSLKKTAHKTEALS